MTVVTRFAPSPTGFLHIGGARTALFNLLFSRRHGGKYLLRIEDTDRQRSTPEAVQQILDSLAWLGLSPDEPPLFQSTRQARHAEVAHQMLAAGRAYLCFCTPEELQQMRELALKEGRPPRYDGRWRDRDPADAPPGAKPAIRIKAPREGETVVEDLVQGSVRVANAELDDMIILRSDGTPTYLHAVVVDDHDMAITHVIRGDDHLTNTFRQVQVYRAMGWDEPRFGHIPLIHGADGSKLSKRHGAVSVLEFRELGYLPEAVCNYLLRLGWGHGDTEIIGRDEATGLFDIDGVGRGAARFDFAKLTAINAHYIRKAAPEPLVADILARLAKRPDLAVGAITRDRLAALMPGLQERARTLADLAEAAAFLAHPRPLPLDAKARALLSPEGRIGLRDLGAVLAATDWTVASLETATRAFAEARGQKLGTVAQPLRAALTGSTQSPPIFDVLAALGREESLGRIEDATR